MKKLREIIRRAEEDKDILAVIVYGSFARGERYNDIDVCLVLNPGKYSKLELSRKKLDYASLVPSYIDIQIFQQLPLYIKNV